MGDCIYCGNPAGFLKRSHRECERVYKQGEAEIISLIAEAAANGSDRRRLQARISKTASASYISGGALRAVMIEGFERAVDRVLDDHLLTEREETAIVQLQQALSVPQRDLDRNGAVTKLVKGGILRDIAEGRMPQQRLEIDGIIPFNLQKSESLVWIFKDVKYNEEKTRTHYKGGSQGVSLRITKGVYYRVGGFKGERVQTSETVHMDTGLMGLTTKHIYFAGPRKRFRIRYDRIVSFDPYEDGIGVMRDAQTAKPQSFVTGDGWFTYNLVASLAQM